MSRVFLRLAIQQRDRGVCALCGRDCDALVRRLRKAVDDAEPGPHRMAVQRFLRCLLEAEGFKPPGAPLWEMDHEIPKCEGGTDRLENLRTLCVPCHKRVTRELAERRARMPKKRILRPIEEWERR